MKFLNHLAAANEQANPELMRLALKLATGAGKTTVMAMLIAWQTINAVRRPRAALLRGPAATLAGSGNPSDRGTQKRK